MQCGVDVGMVAANIANMGIEARPRRSPFWQLTSSHIRLGAKVSDRKEREYIEKGKAFRGRRQMKRMFASEAINKAVHINNCGKFSTMKTPLNVLKGLERTVMRE